MEKKGKKFIIIGVIAVVIIAVIVCLVLFLNKDKKNNTNETTTTTVAVNENVTITFNSNGGDPIESMTVKKGEKVTLPPATKEGYTFVSWTDDEGVVYNSEVTIEKDTTLTANFEEIPKNAKTLTVTFDSKGGSKVKSMKFVCEDNAATLKNLPRPTKDSYEFRTWEDKHSTPILDGAKITCDGDLKLSAVWEYDGPTANPEQNPNPTWKCPDGFELNESTHKCTSKKSPEYYCPEGYTNSTVDNTVCYKYLKEPDSISCKDNSKYYFTQTMANGGVMHFCATEMPSYTGSEQQCNNAGGTLRNNHCVKNIEQVSYSKLNPTCINSVFREGNKLATNAQDGCYDLKQRTYGCKNAGEGYSINYTTGKCVKTVDAVYE